MAIFRRARKHPQHQGLSKFKAGLLAVVLIAVVSYFGFTKTNPFASPYELNAVFETSNNLQPRSPVRIAGVEVGQVKEVKELNRNGGARVKMEIKEKGLPIHEDAELKIRPRIFLEGNFFVDIQPGSPSADTVEDGGTIPINQTATPVQLGEVLTALQSDTREDLRTLLLEYSIKGLGGGGAEGFNRSVPFWEPAYKNASIANDATLGLEPTKDIQRLLAGQQKTFAALVRDENSLKDLVTNFNVTAAAFARQDAALEASIPALRDVLRAGSPALASVNDALPSLSAFARDALPGVRTSGPTIDASLPFIRQARALFTPQELRGLAADLRAATPDLVRLNVRQRPFLAQARTLSACTNDTLLPFVNDTIPDPGEDGDHNNQRVLSQIQRSFVGLAGESRRFDGNGQLFMTQGVPPAKLTKVRPARPNDGGQIPPQHRPDVPCETQEEPDLNAPGGSFATFGGPLTDLLPLPDLPDPPGLLDLLPSATATSARAGAAELGRDLLGQLEGLSGPELAKALDKNLATLRSFEGNRRLPGDMRREFSKLVDRLERLKAGEARSREGSGSRAGSGGDEVGAPIAAARGRP